MSIKFLLGDTRDCLRQLPERSIQVVPTSPPYWGLRDYGIAPTAWADGWIGCLGLEDAPDQYVAHLVEVFREVRRVLRDDGVVWLNLGDCHARPKGKGKRREGGEGYVDPWAEARIAGPDVPVGLKEKDLVGIPFKAAFALQADGWYLRAILPWLKRNVMPESVRDRPTAAVEYVFLLAKSADYFYDTEAVKVPAVSAKGSGNKKRKTRKDEDHGRVSDGPSDLGSSIPWEANGHRNFRNTDPFFATMRQILAGAEGLVSSEEGEPLAFIVNPKAYREAHFATWPPELVEPMIKAATSERGGCSTCGAPWSRIVEKIGDVPMTARRLHLAEMSAESGIRLTQGGGTAKSTLGAGAGGDVPTRASVTGGWKPSCECGAAIVPQTILDPFSGSGTTQIVAERLGRNAIYIDVKPEYMEMAQKRCSNEPCEFIRAPMIIPIEPPEPFELPQAPVAFSLDSFLSRLRT